MLFVIIIIIVVAIIISNNNDNETTKPKIDEVAKPKVDQTATYKVDQTATYKVDQTLGPRELLDLGVAKKREGQFKYAIKLYERALDFTKTEAIIYTSLAKSLYLDNQKERCLDNYCKGLSISIANFARQNNVTKFELMDDTIKDHIIQNFFSTNRHIGHAYIDLDKEAFREFIDSISNKYRSIPKSDIRTIVEYSAADYRFGLAGGGLKTEPVYHNLPHSLDVENLYTMIGADVAKKHVEWNRIMQYL